MDSIDVITDCHTKNGDITVNGRATSKKRLESLPGLGPDNGPDFAPRGRRGSSSSRCEHNNHRLEAKPLKRQRSNRSTRSTTSSNRRRQNEDACTTCLRGTLQCFTIFILIVGCAVLGIGIWLLVTDFGARKVTVIVGNEFFEVTMYLLVAGGGAVALLALCGCCGTIREDKCVLSFYGTTLAIVVVVLGVAAGLAFTFREEFESGIRDRMEGQLRTQYGMNVRSNTQNRRITEAFDAMQRQLHCCGITEENNNPAWVFYSTNTEYLLNARKGPRKVPDSCCAPGDLKLCIGEKTFQGPPRHTNHPEAEKNPYLYTEGCYLPLIGYLKTYSMVVGLVAAVVPVFLIFGGLISFSLCARVTCYPNDDEVDL